MTPQLKPSKRAPRPRKRIARSKPPRRERKTPLSTLKRKLWDLFARYVKDRDGDTCFTCGKAGIFGQDWHAGHFITSSRASTKYDPANVHSQCGRCNNWLRGNHPEYSHRFLTDYGLEKFNALMAASRRTKEWKRHEIEELIAALEKSGADFECLYAERFGL